MSRPASKAPVLPARGVPELIEETREFEFLTPMFGGGTKVREFDPITPVRVPSIRGQLRFWWRAANPRGLSTLEELSKAEAEVFGNTSKRSPLVLSVAEQPSRPSPMEVLDGRHGAVRGLEGLAYGAFPLRGQNDEKHGVLFRFDSPRFTLRLRYPAKIQADVDAAVWAWSTFGGLGARTRRGFGAIQAVNQTLKIEDAFARYVRPAPEAWTGWPRLRRFRVGSQHHPDGLAAQQSLLKLLRDMRQGEGIGRRAGSRPGGFGRSYWPEPDALRRITGRTTPQHKTPLTTADAFPRAAFGLPIVFHFKDRGDPNAELQSIAGDRWASPLVFRPLSVGSKYASVAAELCPRPTRARIKNGRDVEVRVSDQEARAMPTPRRADPDTPHLQFIDPIEAFFRRIP